MHVIMSPWGHSSIPGTSGDKHLSPKGLFLEGHSTMLGTIVGNFVPMGTFFYTGDIRRQSTIIGTNACNYVPMGPSSIPGTSGDKN
jgi:hypothetical protein